MCSSRRAAALFAAAFLAAGCGRAPLPTGCSKKPQRTWERVAVLPFENLSGDPGLDWMGRGLAELIVLNLTGTRRCDPSLASSIRDAGRATLVLHGYHTAGRAYASVEDSGTHRIVVAAEASAGSISALAAALARQVDPAARQIEVRPDSIRAYAAGNYAASVKADARFGPAYVALAQQALAKGDRPGVEQALMAAGGAGLDTPERARAALLASALKGDAAARRNAVSELMKATPADAAPFRLAGDLDTAARAYDSATQAYEQALAREPNPAVYNLLGYVRAYAGDLQGAVRSLERYRAMRPDDVNALDSLGDVHLFLNRLPEAERYYLQAYSRQPAFLAGGPLYKAAWARLLAGERARADAHVERFFAMRPSREIWRAQWEFLTGRRSDGFKRLAGSADPVAPAHLAIWALESGDPAAARQYAARLPAQSPAALALRAALDPAEPAGGSVAELLGRGYGLLLAGRSADALPVLRKLYAMLPPSSREPAPILLAWALIEAGKPDEARPLLERNPIPDVIQDHPLLAAVYPRLIDLRKRAGMTR